MSKQGCFLAGILLLCTGLSTAQRQDKYAADAFLIMRMVQKEHVQPRPMDEAFSSQFFDNFIESLDNNHVIFTEADLAQLIPYRNQMCGQVRSQRTDLLQKATTLFEQRLLRMDSLLRKAGQSPFQFSQSVYLTAAEDSTRPLNAALQEKKLFNEVKKGVLNYIIQRGQMTPAMATGRLRLLTDSLEPIARNWVVEDYRRSIKQVTQGATGLAGMVGTLYCEAFASTFDPHTAYLPKTEKENFESEIGSRSMRFGFTLEKGKEGVLIGELKPGSAAYKSGQLNAGDRFVKLQWENKEALDVSDADIADVSAFLSQSNYGKLAITVKKADGLLRRVELQKESMETDDEDKVKSFLLKDAANTIGYISLPAFYTDWDDLQHNVKGCANDIAKEVMRLRKEGITGLVLDLRYNGGGSMQEAVELAGIFIDAGPVAQLKPAEGKAYSVKDVNRGTIYDGPLVLLVNGASASASEMVAGTLQDYHRAVIMGTPTYGKATSQVIIPLDTISKNGAAPVNGEQRFIKITTEKLYRVTGNTAQREGVVPDVLLPDLSEIRMEREKDNPASLPAQPIDPNRFYTPYAGEALGAMVRKGRMLSDTASWSRNLKKNLVLLKSLEKPAGWPLQLQAALSSRVEMEELGKMLEEKSTAPFTVSYTVLEENKMKLSPALADIDQQWKLRLMHDMWVSTAFQVMSGIK